MSDNYFDLVLSSRLLILEEYSRAAAVVGKRAAESISTDRSQGVMINGGQREAVYMTGLDQALH